MKLKTISCIVLLAMALSFVNKSMAQYRSKILQYRVDTLFPKLRNASEHEKMLIFNKFAFYYSDNNSDSALFFGEKALSLAERFNDPVEKAFAYRNIGNAYSLKGSYRMAIKYLYQSLELARELDSPRKLAELHADLAKLNYDREDYKRGLEYAKMTLDIVNAAELEGNPVMTPYEKGIFIGLTGIVARTGGEYDQALYYLRKFMREYYNMFGPNRITAMFVKVLAETYEYIGEYDSALKYTLKAGGLELADINKNPPEYGGYEMTVGNIYLMKGDPQKALPILKRAFLGYKSDESYFYAGYAARSLGDAFFDLTNIDSAMYYYTAGLNNSLKFLSYLENENTDTSRQLAFSGYQLLFGISRTKAKDYGFYPLVAIYGRLYKINKHIGNLGKSLEYHELMAIYQDSLNKIAGNIEEKKLKLHYETEQMEQELAIMETDNALKQAQLNNTRLTFIGSVLLVLLILLLVLVYFRHRRIRDLREKLVIEQRLFRSQMNPHFIFNSLGSIQSAIINEEPSIAAKYLSKFSKLMRNILDNSLEDFISLEEEISTIENYLALQKLRFSSKFDYVIEIDKEIDIENVSLPPMLAQPFLENAIEHGLKHKDTKGLIVVRLKAHNGLIIYEIEDDGIGRKKAGEMQIKLDNHHKSLATSITRDRIKVLNKQIQQEIKFYIIDLEDEMDKPLGTRVVFEISLS